MPTGATFLTAYMAGMESAVRIGAAVKGGFHHVGFHATGVVAHFSSTIVAAKLLGLDADRIVVGARNRRQHGLGRSGFPGGGRLDQAAPSGLGGRCRHHRRAACASRVLSGRRGPMRENSACSTHICRSTPPPSTSRASPTGLGERWHFADTAIKPYPVCHFIHGCADAAIELHAHARSGRHRRGRGLLAERHDAHRCRACGRKGVPNHRLRGEVQHAVRRRDVPAQGTLRPAGAAGRGDHG